MRCADMPSTLLRLCTLRSCPAAKTVLKPSAAIHILCPTYHRHPVGICLYTDLHVLLESRHFDEPRFVRLEQVSEGGAVDRALPRDLIEVVLAKEHRPQLHE